MSNQDRAEIIWRLVKAKHMKYCAKYYNKYNNSGILELPTSQAELDEDDNESFKYHSTLLALGSEQLELFYKDYQIEVLEEYERSHRFNGLEALASAEVFEFYSRAEYWSLGEAAALINERNPKVITHDHIENDNSRTAISKALKGTLELLDRAERIGTLNRLNRPLDLIQWTMLKDIQMPSRLVELTLARGKNFYDIQAENTKLKAEITQLELLLTPKPISEIKQQTEKPIGTRERSTLLKLFIGLALSNYGLDPKSSDQIKATEIKSDLDLKGINFDDGTIRKYLDEAKQLLSDG